MKLAWGMMALALVACGSGNQSSGVPGNVHFTMSVALPAGSEIFRCVFVTMPAGESYVVGAAHHYTPGSHHLLLYRTDLTTIPAGGDVVQDCYEGLNGSIMSHVRGAVYGSQVPDGSYTMPSGVAFHMAGKEVLLLQAHYLNASAKDLQAGIDVGLSTTSDGSKIVNRAGNLFYYDPFIDVPPNGTAKAGARCTLTNDVTLLNVFPHYHARGVAYQAYLDLPGQPAATTPFYTSTDWEHPAAFTGQPLQLKAGTAIRYYCNYQNQGAAEYFQGPSAAKNEMCMFTGLYYPQVDDAFETCNNGNFDQFGVGTQTCAQTTSCLGACPPATGNPSQGDIPDCWQKCIVSSCPSSSTPLFSQLRCMQTKCANCTAAGTCQQCALNSCGNETTACFSAACN